MLELDSKPFDRTLASSESGLGRLGSAGSRAMVGLGAAIASGAVVGLGALAAGAAVSLKTFGDFEAQMNEVFTLLPGISDKAMTSMTRQVQGFAVKFGVLPEKVVPALYQALSAGVPPGNVFDFLETAQKAAKAGVTDLETAVNGITSTVNAYGSDVLSAAHASDLMFTAVRVGKTTFGEMSEALFQVNPVAAALGVKFGDVTAALAAMTSQGVPTSVATTQLRQLMVELSKEGTVTSDTFKKLSGKSFKDFVAGGGNVQGALKLLEQHAKDSGVGINDLFSSVEAGGAALALTGKGTGKFTDSLKAMESSAGATETAYAQSAKGWNHTWDRIRAGAQVALQRIGELIGPHLVKALEVGERAIRRLAAVFQEGGLQGILDLLRQKFDGLSPAMKGVVAAVVGIGVALAASVAVIALAVTAIAALVAAMFLLPAAAVGGVVYAYNRFDEFREAVDHVLSLVRLYWATFGATILANAQNIWNMILAVVRLAISAVRTAITVVLAIINGDWGKAWNALRQHFAVVWQTIGTIVSNAGAIIVRTIASALSLAGQAVMAGLGWIWRQFLAMPGRVLSPLATLASIIVRTIDSALSRARQAVATGLSAILGFWASLPGRMVSILSGLGPRLFSAAGSALNSMRNAISVGIGLAVGLFTALPGRALAALGGIGSRLYNAGRELIQGFLNGISDRIGAVRDKLAELTNMIPKLKGPPAKDRRLLRPAGRMAIEGFSRGIDDRVGMVRRQLRNVTAMLAADAARATVVPIAAAPMAATAGRSPLAATGTDGRQGPAIEINGGATFVDPVDVTVLTRKAEAMRRRRFL